MEPWLNSRLMKAKKHVHRSWCCSQGSIWCRGLIQTGLRPSLAVNSLQKCSHGHFNLTQYHNIFSTLYLRIQPWHQKFHKSNPDCRQTKVYSREIEPWRDAEVRDRATAIHKSVKTEQRHDETWTTMLRDKTRHMSQDCTTASRNVFSKRSKLSTSICFSPFLEKVLVTGSIARSATCRYLIYSEANFDVFRPAGVTRCTDWGEIWHMELWGF